MSSHPGSTVKEAVELAEYCRDMGYMPEQVQDFYPTPSTLSTCMYYTGLDPRTMEPVYVPKNPHEKAMQRALIQYRNPANYELVKEALMKAGRTDLIGFGEECLIRPRQFAKERAAAAGKTDRKTAAAGGKAERRGEAKKPQSRWASGGASPKKAESKITPGTIIPTEEAPPERIPVSGKEDDHEDSDHNRCFFRDGTGICQTDRMLRSAAGRGMGHRQAKGTAGGASERVRSSASGFWRAIF